MNKFWSFSNIDNDNAELYIRGEIIDGQKWIYDWFGIKATDKNQFIAELEALGNKKNITVYINSVGGDLFAGLTINNVLTRNPANITVVIDGLAASAATIIAMAGDTRKMPSNAIFAIHNALINLSGAYNIKDLEKIGKTLDDVGKAIVQSYKKTGLSDDEIQTLLNDERRLTAQDAKELGFITEVMYNYPLDIVNLEGYTIINSVAHKFNYSKEEVQNTMGNQPSAQTQTPAPVANALTGQVPQQGQSQASSLPLNSGTPAPVTNVVTAQTAQQPSQPTSEMVTNDLQAERARLQAIDAIANQIDEELVNDAKYVNPISAEQLALKAMTEGKFKAPPFSNAVAANIASGVNGVESGTIPPAEAPKAKSTNDIIASLAKAENAKRMGVKQNDNR